MSLFVGLDHDPKELGIDQIQENAWAFRGSDYDRDFAKFTSQSLDELFEKKHRMPGVFVGFPSSKDPAFLEDFGPNKCTVTVIAVVSWSWFAEFETSKVH